ncbi:MULTISPECIES: hypothetical protein [unclassified Mesorhizobium]|uniref:hypothetical protein n=1 Tax=unclassified Mesorhizobium TaxID=325217 RepID=UPI0003CE1ACE|nr:MULTISPECIES: hypothetical protein [unclassified Mesorhizobium]ESY21734.1 hypothetical protein X751_05650 [Mesorhizobium sp. LNJC395A00]WJI72871.1 hypothetical protein NLY37_17700 [Mesorhizobium sp. C395A]
MATIINLNEVRAARQLPPDLPIDEAFVEVWQPIFEALELVETIQLPRTARARELLLRGLAVMLEREQRRLGQCAKP